MLFKHNSTHGNLVVEMWRLNSAAYNGPIYLFNLSDFHVLAHRGISNDH